jgi:hypothetical protein
MMPKKRWQKRGIDYVAEIVKPLTVPFFGCLPLDQSDTILWCSEHCHFLFITSVAGLFVISRVTAIYEASVRHVNAPVINNLTD